MLSLFRSALFANASAIFLLLVLSNGCGRSTEEDTEERVIRSEGDVLDVRISSAKKSTSFASEQISRIGFDGEDESRLLLYFPKIDELYEDEVVISSITAIEVIVKCEDVQVNPGKIALQPISRPWSQYATWKSRHSLDKESAWKEPGGDVYSGTGKISPDIRREDKELFELSFDVTSLVKDMVVKGRKNYGFVVSVAKSSLNEKNFLKLQTFNAEEGAPSSALVFSTEDVIE